jgi:hypothetical protein
MAAAKTPVVDNVVLKDEFLALNPGWSIEFHDTEHRWYAEGPDGLTVRHHDLGRLLKWLHKIVKAA